MINARSFTKDLYMPITEKSVTHSSLFSLHSFSQREFPRYMHTFFFRISYLH